MFEFHKHKRKYFDINIANTTQYILPFIESKFPLKPNMRVLEIGCGEGGVLKPFLDRGMIGVGVELDEVRLIDAEKWLSPEIASGKLTLISRDIYSCSIQDLGGLFDLIILKDVIEHIPNQEKLMIEMGRFLVPGGVIFFGFPPWQMPLGGHQQILKNKWLSKIPYYHLLPMPLYLWILEKAGENVQEMKEIKETGISIERFEHIVNQSGLLILNKIHFLINPIYQYKFGWKPKKQFKIVTGIPVLRNFLTTCVYYLVQKNNKNEE